MSTETVNIILTDGKARKVHPDTPALTADGFTEALTALGRDGGEPA